MIVVPKYDTRGGITVPVPFKGNLPLATVMYNGSVEVRVKVLLYELALDLGSSDPGAGSSRRNAE